MVALGLLILCFLSFEATEVAAGALVLINFIFYQKERKQINFPFIHANVLFKFDEQIFHHKEVSQKVLPLATGLQELAWISDEDYCSTAAVISG